mgnify:CR=1 FL=1
MEEKETEVKLNSLGEPVTDTVLEVKDGYHRLKLKFEPVMVQEERENGSQ